MKNIHVLPTEKPSRLSEFGGQFTLTTESTDAFRNYNIYITSDEEIKERDWFLTKTNDIIICGNKNNFTPIGKKIILTTELNLIKDGVQAIDDEFLEWFVKNPSCEEVEVEKGKMKVNDDGCRYGFPDMSLYEIIIPKEESIVGATLDVPFNGKRVRFENLMPEQFECLLKISELYIISGTRRNASI
jgi:hypothetical protein